MERREVTKQVETSGRQDILTVQICLWCGWNVQ